MQGKRSAETLSYPTNEVIRARNKLNRGAYEKNFYIILSRVLYIQLHSEPKVTYMHNCQRCIHLAEVRFNYSGDQMKRKHLLNVFFFSLVLFSSFPAYAGSPYAGLTVGLAYLNDSSLKGSKSGDLSYDYGEAYSYAHGFDLGCIRLEGEVGYQKNDFETFEPGRITADGDLSILSLLANGYYYYEIPNSFIVPIVSAGIGAANVEYEDDIDKFSEDDTVLAYQISAGLGVKISPSVTVNAMYRYFATQDASFREGDENLELDISSHNVLLDLKVNF